MTEERKPLENTEGYFLGKELAGEGEKEGKKGRRYKAKFKPSMDSEKAFSFTCFDPLRAKGTKQLSDLEEGKEYRICFASEERTNDAGQTYTSKTAIGFYSPGGNFKSGGTTAKLDLSKFDNFKEKYMEAMKKEGKTLEKVHMLGSFIASFEKERTAELLKKCEEALK